MLSKSFLRNTLKLTMNKNQGCQEKLIKLSIGMTKPKVV